MGKIFYTVMIIVLLPSLLFAAEPYGLKGDTLGMDLKSFKKKYHRSVEGHKEDLPWCSDYQPDQEIKTTLSEAWHHKARIVNCRISFPCEERKGGRKFYVAGVATDMLIYHFIDSKLFMVTAGFKNHAFDELKNNLLAKYGIPATREFTNYQKGSGAKPPVENLSWNNGVSSIRINTRPGNPDSFDLIYQHKELSGIYDKRKPRSRTDDL